MKNKEVLTSSALIFLFFLSILALSIKAGSNGKVFLSPPDVKVFSSPDETIEFWRKAGLKGRVLYQFDKMFSVKTLKKLDSKDYFINIAIIENIAREVNYVVPDTNWDRISKFYEGTDKDIPLNKPIKLYTAGTPVYVMKLSHVIAEEEPVMISSRGSQWETSAITSLTEKSILKSDTTTFMETISPGIIERLKSAIYSAG
ncbi:hypothetical protein ACFL4R_00420 [Nitrospirota bacterium]